MSGGELLLVFTALPLGHFDYSARSPDGWRAAGALEVVAGSEPQQRVTVSLSR